MLIDVGRQQREELLAQRVKDAGWDGRHERSPAHGALAPSRAWPSCLPYVEPSRRRPSSPTGGRPYATPRSTSSGSVAAPTSPPPTVASATSPPTSSTPSLPPDRSAGRQVKQGIYDFARALAEELDVVHEIAVELRDDLQVLAVDHQDVGEVDDLGAGEGSVDCRLDALGEGVHQVRQALLRLRVLLERNGEVQGGGHDESPRGWTCLGERRLREPGLTGDRPVDRRARGASRYTVRRVGAV